MRHVNSSDFKSHFGDYLDLIGEEPVTVNKLGKPAAVLVSIAEYERLSRLEALVREAVRETAGTVREPVDYEEFVAVLAHWYSSGG